MRSLLAALLILAAFDASTASAQTGVVLRFSGSGGSQARSIVVREVQREYELVDRRSVESTARNLGADLDTPEGRALVADDMGLSVIVDGAVRGRGRRGRTTIRLYASDGSEVGTDRTGAPLGSRGRSQVARATRNLLEAARDILASTQPGISMEDEEPPDWGETQSQEPNAWEIAIAEEQAEAERLRAEEEEEEEEEDAVDAPLSMPLVAAMVGLEFRTRSARIDFVGVGGREFTASIHPELSVRLESFPLNTRADLLRGLYLEATFAISLGLKSNAFDPGTLSDVVIANTALRFFVQAGYFYSLEDDSFRIGALIGYGIDSFSFAQQTLMPSSSYSQLRIGLVGAAKVYGDLVRARVDAGFRLLFGTGELGSEFGPDDGGTGFDLGLALVGFHDSGATYGVRFGYTKYSLSFAGVGADPDAALGSSVSGSDSSINLTVEAGYSF